jgi:ectoine hydroxylase-related dioxygenase (phytanoyl-CoA dioxygenase family)
MPSHTASIGITIIGIPNKRMFQGVLALTDTATDQGGFRCVPSLYRDRDAWPNKPIIDADGQENWLADITGREIVHVPAQAGDFLVWDSLLAHGNSKTLSSRPRMAFYVLMGRADQWDERMRQSSVESWRTGSAFPGGAIVPATTG